MGYTVAEWMERGSAALNRGDLESAVDCFKSAQDRLHGEGPGHVEQQLGICYRLMREPYTADILFDQAFALAETDTHRGQIKRDWAMAALDLRDYDAAQQLLEESLTLLKYDEDVAQEDGRVMEYFVTLGFMGRVYYSRQDFDGARLYYRTADLQLTGIAPYELNNLVWLLKATPWKARIGLARRAMRLAKAAGNTTRQKQIALLVACKPLALRLERHHT